MSQKRAIWIPDTYSLNKELNVYFPDSGEGRFNYSDGDAIEDKILETILAASDLSIGSPELNSKIQDWPTLYHFSPQRADLIRPLKNIIKGDILEIGSGCGAITRYLAETGAQVTAVEGSGRRARITAARCRDLDNVSVYCDNFNDFKSDKKFDIVTLIGVLEYSNMFMDGTSAPQKMLEKIREFLKPDGRIVIAIENQLGLKYFAGAPEDHLNKPFAGIENNYKENGPVTFGRKQLEQLFAEAGFNHSEFLFPFPDYKLPSAILTERGCDDSVLNLSDLLKFNVDHDHNGKFTRTFSVEQSLPVIVKNELIKDLANSFLIVISHHIHQPLDSSVLAYTFSTQRKKEFCKLNRFIRQDKKYIVAKERIYNLTPATKAIKHRIVDEAYIPGYSYINQLENILNTPGWSTMQVVEWATPWFRFLKKQSQPNSKRKGDFLISGEFLDAIPQNFIIDLQGDCVPFDLEWVAPQQLDLSYVLFRGLMNSFNHYTCTVPNEHFSLQIGDLSLLILSKLLPEVELDVSKLIKTENEFLNTALGIENIVDTLFVKNIAKETSVKEIKIAPMDEGIIQVFWGASDGVFYEEKSAFQKLPFQNEPQKHVFVFQPTHETVEYLRFDIGDKIGFLNIHSIQLKTIQGQPVWSFDVHAVQYKNNVIFIHSPEHFGNRIIQLATTQDPHFVVHLASVFAGRNLLDLIIEIEISRPDTEQFNKLNQLINIPLSYAPQAEVRRLMDQTNQLIAEKNNAEQQLNLKTNESEQLLSRLTSMNIQVETEKKIIQELKADKEYFSKELNLKNEQITLLQTEKEKLSADVIAQHNKTDEVLQQKNELTGLLAQKEEVLNTLIQDKKRLEQQVAQLNAGVEQSSSRIADITAAFDAARKNINELIQDKTNLEKAGTQLQKNLDDLILQKTDLNAIIKEQQNQVRDIHINYKELFEIKENIHRENEVLKLNLTEKNMENKALSERMASLNERLEFFIQNYENKNLLQVVVNQLKRGKRRN